MLPKRLDGGNSVAKVSTADAGNQDVYHTVTISNPFTQAFVYIVLVGLQNAGIDFYTDVGGRKIHISNAFNTAAHLGPVK